jgi:hypothetical protein
LSSKVLRPFKFTALLESLAPVAFIAIGWGRGVFKAENRCYKELNQLHRRFEPQIISVFREGYTRKFFAGSIAVMVMAMA